MNLGDFSKKNVFLVAVENIDRGLVKSNWSWEGEFSTGTTIIMAAPHAAAACCYIFSLYIIFGLPVVVRIYACVRCVLSLRQYLLILFVCKGCYPGSNSTFFTKFSNNVD